MTTLFENRRQTWKLRLVLCFALPLCAAGLWWGWSLAQTCGLSPGDGGVLRPPLERYAMGAFVGGLALLTAVAFMVYAAHYAVKVARDGQTLIVDTLTPLGLGTWRREFAVSRVGGTSYHEGRMRTPRHNVNAPWMTLRIAGRWLPFILDAQAETMIGSGLSTLSKAKPNKLRAPVSTLSRRRKRKTRA